MSEQQYYVDAEMLRKHGACDPEVEHFVEAFGEGPVLLNLRNVHKALDASLDIPWLAWTLYLSANCCSTVEKRALELYDEMRYGDAEHMLIRLRKLAELWAEYKRTQE